MQRLALSELLRALQILERNVAVTLMYSGLRPAQFRLLELLSTGGELTVTEVSERLHITRATASVQINDLIRAGIVMVADNERDRRSFHIHLTELGMNKLKVARSDLGVMQDKLSQHYSQQTINTLNSFASHTLKSGRG